VGVPSLNALMSAFGVVSAVDGDTMSATQHLTRDLADHRGRVEMPAYAMMAESITSGTFWHSFDEAVGTVQSWLSLTAGAPIGLDQRLFATTELLHSDGQQGAVTLRISNDRDEVVCGGLARCVLVGRTGDHLAKIKDAMPLKTGDLVADVVPVSILPPSIDPRLDGLQILAAISDGTLSAGALCELLSATVTASEDQTRMTVSPQPWMANPLGAIQGGVMAAIMGQACSFAGQLHTGPGQSHSLADLSIYFFRSPPFDQAVSVVTAPDRIGRRLGTVSATMTSADGVVFARATANVRYS
jgi:acyl-coenzyme A thioesterase PaaI-like protein